MFGRVATKRHKTFFRVVTLFGALFCCAAVFAQEPAAPQKPVPLRASTRITVDKSAGAPQVVTIIHRLNGLKMFRLLLRSEEQVQSIAALDTTFNLMSDVHTNVIAGLALDDGETIVAWLPEAEVEFGPPAMPPVGFEAKAPVFSAAQGVDFKTDFKTAFD